METVRPLIEPGSRLVTSSTPTLLPLQISGSAAADPTCPSQAPCRQASERVSLRKSLLTHSRWSRKACPQTPDPSGLPASIEMSMPRSRAMSSPKPATHRSKIRPGFKQEHRRRQEVAARKRGFADLLVQFFRRFRIQDCFVGCAQRCKSTRKVSLQDLLLPAAKRASPGRIYAERRPKWRL